MKAWQKALLSLSGLFEKQTELKPYETEEGKEMPFHAEFTGDKPTSGGTPVEHEQAAWKEQNAQFNKLRSKGEPDTKVNDKKDFGSPLLQDKGARVEDYQDKDMNNVFSSVRTGNKVTFLKQGKYSELDLKSKFINPSKPEATEPEDKSIEVVAYKHSSDGNIYTVSVQDFNRSFRKFAHDTAFDVPAGGELLQMVEEYNKLTGDGLETVPDEAVAYLRDRNNVYFFSHSDLKQMIHEAKESPEEERLEHETGEEAPDEESRLSSRKVSVAPPGWEGTVKHMKKHRKISNPWALAWYMKNKGEKSHIKETSSDWRSLAKLAENVDFQRKPDGTININVEEGTPGLGLQPSVTPTEPEVPEQEQAPETQQ